MRAPKRRVWHEGAACHYIMFAKPPGAKAPQKYRVDSFPVGSRSMNLLMPEIMAQVGGCCIRLTCSHLAAADCLHTLCAIERGIKQELRCSSSTQCDGMNTHTGGPK